MESTHPFSVSFAPCFQAVLCRSRLFFRMFLDKLFQICADRFIMKQKRRCFSPFLQSPSSRRAWIEISRTHKGCCGCTVALLAEGVDRNRVNGKEIAGFYLSPSSRRAWIEIALRLYHGGPASSPSSRRAWIEIIQHLHLQGLSRSPSSRRAWIEITSPQNHGPPRHCRPPRGGRG